MRVLKLVMLGVLGALGLVLGTQLAQWQKARGVGSPSDNGIVRLYIYYQQGAAHCSGAVLSDTLLLTAAHCVAPPEMMLFQAPSEDSIQRIEVRSQADVGIGIVAAVLNYDRRSDLALLKGNFKSLRHHGVETSAEVINKLFGSADLIGCGYPMNGRFTCSKYSESRHAVFAFSAFGFAWPGMSGGPVFDTSSGKIIAVISDADDDRIILSPTIELYKDLRVDENL